MDDSNSDWDSLPHEEQGMNLEEFCNIMKKYWIILALKLAEGFVSTFAQNDINNGLDYTFQFTWITEEGRIRFIQNATDLSDNEKSILLKDEALP